MRGNEEKGQDENEGIPDLTQRSHLTIPSRFDAVGGCSRHVVSPTLCPSSFFRTALTLPNTHIHSDKLGNSLILVVPASSSSILTSLRRSGHISLGAGNDPPRPRGWSLSTLVINTNCSIQTFKMCLTFLWHVIPSPPRSPF